MLAIVGGTPVRKALWPIWPPTSKSAINHLTDVLDSHRWTIRGWYTGQLSKQTQFAQKFAKFNNIKHCAAVSSGSSGLLVALEALDIGYGDEVIVPVYTWIATGISVTNVNAIPVFVDVDPETGCISPNAIEAAITPRTRAIIPVHLHCAVAEMETIMQIASKHNLYVIEDCAQAHGARYFDKFVGTLGHLGVFSMNQEKILCCGEGGAIITNDDNIYDRIGRLRADGSGETDSPPVIGKYELEDKGGLMGANYCMSDFQAAVLLAELDFVEERNRIRELNAAFLDDNLSALPGLTSIKSSPGTTARTYFKYAIRRDPNAFEGVPTSKLCEALSAELGFSVEQTECQPLHQNPLYCPLSKKRHHLDANYIKKLNISGLRFPYAEKHYANTIVFHHRILLGNRRDMGDIVEAFAKVQKYARLLV